MRTCLSEAVGVSRKARESGAALPEGETARTGDTYDALTGEGLPPLRSGHRGRPKRRPGHKPVIRLRDHRAEILEFLRRPEVLPTNSLAGRDVRPPKVRQRISGSFRTGSGAAGYAVPGSVIETAKRQGWDPLPTLRAAPAELIARLRTGPPALET